MILRVERVSVNHRRSSAGDHGSCPTESPQLSPSITADVPEDFRDRLGISFSGISINFRRIYGGIYALLCSYVIGGSRGGVRDARPPLGVQILSISCSFQENLACSRPPWRVHAPPSGKSWIRHCMFYCSLGFFPSPRQ